MGQTEKRRCLNCGESFTADARNARHQRYCPALPCKAASKRASQAKWLAKPENQDYHRGAQAVARVKAWRAAHPGYGRRKGSPPDAVQEDWVTAAEATTAKTAETAAAPAPSSVTPPLPAQKSCNAPSTPLQDFLNAQPVVLVGLVAHLLGSALQEDIASALSRLLQLGLDIRGGNHDCDQAGLEPRTSAPGARALQLARSPPVREHTIEKADVCAWALYLFLVTVADAHGLSYYSEATLSRRLRLDLQRLAQARRDLVALDLIAYDPPLYQVLSLPESTPVAVRLGRLHALLAGRP